MAGFTLLEADGSCHTHRMCFVVQRDMNRYNAEAMANTIVRGLAGKTVSDGGQNDARNPSDGEKAMARIRVPVTL